MGTSSLGSKLGIVKKVFYSIISLFKILIPLLTIEGEIMQSVAFLEPFFLSIFDFLSQNLNIVLFVGGTTLLTGAFTYFIFPIGETACLIATAIGYLLSPRINELFASSVAAGASSWDAAAICAPWVFWICLPTIFVGAICICKRVSRWGGLVKTLLISGLVTLIVGLLLGLASYICYGLEVGGNPAQVCMFISLVLVIIAEQVAIFCKKTS